MPIAVIVLLIWYFVIGQNKPNIFRKLEGKLGKIFGTLVVLSVLSFLIPGMFGITIVLLSLFCSLLPIILPIWIIKNIVSPKKAKKKNKRGKIVQEEEYMRTSLTRSVPKRRKIVEKFNKKHDLGLEEEEVNRIVDASYTSFAWEKEIYDMSKDYDSIYEWYNGITNWLRVYLKVLPIEHVSSDFNRQRQICLDTFKQIFDEIKPSAFKSLDDCIDYINNRYLANLDETTFMIAYRFLEAHDIRYDLPAMDLIKNVSELDRLKEKYDKDEKSQRQESSIDILKKKYDDSPDAEITKTRNVRMY